MSELLTLSTLAYVSAAAAIAAAVAGALRVRRGTADWTFVLGLCLLATERVLGGLSLEAKTLGESEFWQEWRLLALAPIPGTWLVFSLTFARTNARDFLRKWRLIWPAALLAPTILALVYRHEFFAALHSDPTERWVLVLGWPATLLFGLLLPASVLVLMNLERTYRASVGTLRWRIKFMLLGVGIVFVTAVYTTSQAVLYRSLTASLETVSSIALLTAVAVIARYLFRNTRFDTEVYPSQSVLEGSLIAVLAGVYLLGVGVVARFVSQFGGDSAFAVKAFVLFMALVLLAVLFQSDRMRSLVRRMVSRHFQRPVYDYQTIWRRYSERTAALVDQTELCREVVTLTAEVFQALSVTIWLADESREEFSVAASTSLSAEKARAAVPAKPEIAAVIAYFEASPQPVDVEASEEPWAVALRRWHPSEFSTGGHRICAPLIRHGRVSGVIMIGDRISGISFPEQDMDMLLCVAGHVATRLLNVQLAQRLMQAKELEAFQTMAAFFVHDLKNAASTLNLMLQNLPLHFNDPAFREDALRGMGKTVAHMNRLISRLGQLRHDLSLNLAPVDFNAAVQSALRGLENPAGVTITKDFQALPPCPLDQEQFGKVVTNLVLNAIEATPSAGSIRLATVQTGGEAVLTVTDTGCGMSPEFMQRSLFRPFQTTKKTGLGIGMFQSKMIVEAHGGRMTVASTPGQGTTFQVFLPLHGK